jgi:hypothetical protein
MSIHTNLVVAITYLRWIIFVGFNFAQMALELMASPAVELRCIGIRLLIFFFSSHDGKLDMKQVNIFDKMNGFHAMAKQLSGHMNACDDLVLEGLFSLLTWQVQGLIPTSRPSSTELAKMDKKPEGRR